MAVMTDYPYHTGVINRTAIILFLKYGLLITIINRLAHRRFVNLMA